MRHILQRLFIHCRLSFVLSADYFLNSLKIQFSPMFWPLSNHLKVLGQK